MLRFTFLLFALSFSLAVHGDEYKQKKIKTQKRYDKYEGFVGEKQFDQDSNVVFETEFFWDRKIVGRYFEGGQCTTEIVYASYGTAVIIYQYDKAGHLAKKYVAAYPKYPLDDMKRVNRIDRDSLVYKNRAELFNDSIVQVLLKRKKKDILEDYIYNAKGQLIYDSLRYIAGGKTQWHKYSYNEQGQLATKDYEASLWEGHVAYSYNASGKMIGMKNYNKEGVVMNWEDYFYGADGRLAEVHNGNWIGGTSVEKYTYYEGLLIMKEFRNPSEELNILDVYGYNEYGFMTEHLFLNPGLNSNWQAVSWTYEYY